MPYIGNPPAERFTSFAYQDLTGGSGTSFTLDNAVGNPQEIEVFVNNVRQEPGVAYTVSGTALTMTGSIASTDDFYVVFQGKAIQTATHPSDRALTATDGTFNKVDVDNIRIDGNTISSTDTNGNVIIDPNGTGHLLVNNSAYGSNGTLVVQQTADSKGIAIVDSAAANTFFLENDGTINRIRNNASIPLTLETASTERMRITSAGKVGIGDSSPDSPLEVRKDNPDNGRLASFGSNGTPFTSVLSGLNNSITIGRSRVNVAPNTTTSLVSGYGGSVVLVTLLQDSGVADVQRTVLVSHAWSSATVLFENNYGGNSPTVTFSALSGALRVNHNHSGNIQFNVAGFIISGPNSG